MFGILSMLICFLLCRLSTNIYLKRYNEKQIKLINSLRWDSKVWSCFIDSEEEMIKGIMDDRGQLLQLVKAETGMKKNGG